MSERKHIDLPKSKKHIYVDSNLHHNLPGAIITSSKEAQENVIKLNYESKQESVIKENLNELLEGKKIYKLQEDLYQEHQKVFEFEDLKDEGEPPIGHYEKVTVNEKKSLQRVGHYEKVVKHTVDYFYITHKRDDVAKKIKESEKKTKKKNQCTNKNGIEVSCNNLQFLKFNHVSFFYIIFKYKLKQSILSCFDNYENRNCKNPKSHQK